MRWNYQTLAFDLIDTNKIQNNHFLFYTLCGASFVEITSDIYEKNLTEVFGDDDTTGIWLRDTWEPEEIQHGNALRAYIHHVWPSFDWDRAYAGFRQEYAELCTIEAFQPSKAREMLARIVVETGTSTFYKGYSRYAHHIGEPVLAELLELISKDEIYHYDQFTALFKSFNRDEKLGKDSILTSYYQRLKEAGDNDLEIAFKHAYKVRENQIFERSAYDAFRQELKAFASEFYPYTMAVKMLIKPLELNSILEKATIPVVRSGLKMFGI